MKEHPTRREFTRTVAGVAGALALVPWSVSAASGQTPTPTPTPLPTPTAPPAPTPLALALLEVAKVRFGTYLSPEQLPKVQANVESLVAISGRLRAVKLKNSDEPDFVFSA